MEQSTSATGSRRRKTDFSLMCLNAEQHGANCHCVAAVCSEQPRALIGKTLTCLVCNLLQAWEIVDMPAKGKKARKPAAKARTTGRGKAVRPRARAKDVLGTPAVRERIPSKWQENYAHLLELHNKLRLRKGDLHQQAREEKPVFSEHMADAGTDNYDQDFALSMASSEQNAIYEIEEAMRRIKEGTYGICEMTGKPIEPARLSAIPWTRFSAEAERELEKRGEVGRTRLGDRMPVVRSQPAEAEEQDEETAE